MGALERTRPSIAIVDINLGDMNSFPVADRRMELGVPFLFANGYEEQAHMPQDHCSRGIVQKPCAVEILARVIASVFWNGEGNV